MSNNHKLHFAWVFIAVLFGGVNYAFCEQLGGYSAYVIDKCDGTNGGTTFPSARCGSFQDTNLKTACIAIQNYCRNGSLGACDTDGSAALKAATGYSGTFEKCGKFKLYYPDDTGDDVSYGYKGEYVICFTGTGTESGCENYKSRINNICASGYQGTKPAATDVFINDYRGAYDPVKSGNYRIAVPPQAKCCSSGNCVGTTEWVAGTTGCEYGGGEIKTCLSTGLCSANSGVARCKAGYYTTYTKTANVFEGNYCGKLNCQKCPTVNNVIGTSAAGSRGVASCYAPASTYSDATGSFTISNTTDCKYGESGLSSSVLRK